MLEYSMNLNIPMLVLYAIVILSAAALARYMRSRRTGAKPIKRDELGGAASTFMLPEADEEAVLLVSADYQLLGANLSFYAITGIKEIQPYITSVESLAAIFPEQAQQLSIKRLHRLLRQGEGSIETEVKLNDGEAQLMQWRLHTIREGEEIVVYYLTLNNQQKAASCESLHELKYELQAGETRQAQLAFFLLSIEGLQMLLDDMKVSSALLLEQLKQELDILDEANIVYTAPLEQEQLIIVLAGGRVQDHVDVWAQSMIEAIHYTIYNYSPQHCVCVTAGISLSRPYEHNAESMLQNAGYAMNMIKHRGKNGYYIYSSVVS